MSHGLRSARTHLVRFQRLQTQPGTIQPANLKQVIYSPTSGKARTSLELESCLEDHGCTSCFTHSPSKFGGPRGFRPPKRAESLDPPQSQKCDLVRVRRRDYAVISRDFRSGGTDRVKTLHSNFRFSAPAERAE
jgi:hypothetical protein